MKRPTFDEPTVRLHVMLTRDLDGTRAIWHRPAGMKYVSGVWTSDSANTAVLADSGEDDVPSYESVLGHWPGDLSPGGSRSLRMSLPAYLLPERKETEQ